MSNSFGSFNMITKVAFVGALLSMFLFSPAFSKHIENTMVGDYSSVSNMEPNIVINYLGTCSGTPIDTSSCLVTTFISETFGNEKWGGRCLPFESSEVESLVDSAFEACRGGNTNETEPDRLTAILTFDSCFSKLCDDNAHNAVEASWFRSCANVHLPNGMNEMFPVMTDDEDLVVSCMVHKAMSSFHSDLGLPDPSEDSMEKCYPPGYFIMDTFCATSLAPTLFNQCKNAVSSSDSDDYNSMRTGVQVNEEEAISDFCSLMIELSSDQNLHCLVPLCDLTSVPVPVPVSVPTPFPTPFPTRAPTTVPTPVPVPLPTLYLSTTSPTFVPSASATLTRVPSAAPSSSPSVQPTHSEVQAIVETDVFTVFTLVGVSNADIGNSAFDSFFRVLSDGVAKAVETDVDGITAVEIIVIGGLPTRHRDLVVLDVISETDGTPPPPPTIDVEFKATIVRECFLSDCNDGSFPAKVAAAFKKAFEASIPVGLTKTINQQANVRKVEVFKTATVESKPLAYFSYTSRVLDAKGSVVSSGHSMISFSLLAAASTAAVFAMLPLA